jgi:hypothetical protein
MRGTAWLQGVTAIPGMALSDPSDSLTSPVVTACDTSHESPQFFPPSCPVTLNLPGRSPIMQSIPRHVGRGNARWRPKDGGHPARCCQAVRAEKGRKDKLE